MSPLKYLKEVLESSVPQSGETLLHGQSGAIKIKKQEKKQQDKLIYKLNVTAVLSVALKHALYRRLAAEAALPAFYVTYGSAKKVKSVLPLNVLKGIKMHSLLRKYYRLVPKNALPQKLGRQYVLTK